MTVCGVQYVDITPCQGIAGRCQRRRWVCPLVHVVVPIPASENSSDSDEDSKKRNSDFQGHDPGCSER